MELINICKAAKEASGFIADKNAVLLAIADRIIVNSNEILAANRIDVENARNECMKESLIDRLSLDKDRVIAMAKALRHIASLPDPIGEVLSGKTLENGLKIIQKRVPLGVVAVIYESRPNVTIDSFGLCFKSGNCVILRGSKTAIMSNTAIVKTIKEILIKHGILDGVVNLIEDTNRETTVELMKMHEYIDVLIPRGGAGLIKACIENSTIPIIETGTGNCHIYVDSSADFDMAIRIIENAKTQRVGVCNSCESVLVHKDISDKFVPLLKEKLPQVEFRESDYEVEFLDLILSFKTVDNLEQAIKHINKYSTHHSDSIITQNYANSQKFLDQIDSACVYVNASTRFTDGEQFGLGAEIGISTQKLHVRGPFALEGLTTSKYIIYGDGQIRS